jgi:cytochrome o ubiquinol oxidase subunit I
MYINLFWAWGHPEVYILVLPAFGIFSEVVPVFSQKKLFGYTSMVWAIAGISILSFIVWLHHFFTMGAGANVNAFFGIMTMIIAIPTGVKIFNWIFTMFRGRIQFKTPMYWFLGFIITFTIGGMAGILMSIPGADFQVHNSLFLIAHFHFVIIGGVVFGFFAGYTYWFPKFVGFKLNERLGKYAFWCWLIGFLVAFSPLYLLGFMGATRRLNYYDVADWQPLFIVASIGALIIAAGVAFQVLQVIVSIKQRHENRDTTGDPWNGRNLEWSTSSPPPFYNFAIIPEVHGRDAFWTMKHAKTQQTKPRYHDIHMPANSAQGFYIGVFSFLFGFGMIWHIFWLAALCFIGMIVCIIVHLSQKHPEYTVTAAEIEKIENRKGVA